MVDDGDAASASARSTRSCRGSSSSCVVVVPRAQHVAGAEQLGRGMVGERRLAHEQAVEHEQADRPRALERGRGWGPSGRAGSSIARAYSRCAASRARRGSSSRARSGSTLRSWTDPLPASGMQLPSQVDVVALSAGPARAAGSGPPSSRLRTFRNESRCPLPPRDHRDTLKCSAGSRRMEPRDARSAWGYTGRRSLPGGVIGSTPDSGSGSWGSSPCPAVGRGARSPPANGDGESSRICASREASPARRAARTARNSWWSSSAIASGCIGATGARFTARGARGGTRRSRGPGRDRGTPRRRRPSPRARRTAARGAAAPA